MANLEPRKGKKIGKYLLKAKLGVGGTSEVWKATTSQNDSYAVKIFSKQHLNYATHEKSAHKEFKILNSLNSPYYLKPIEIDEDSDNLYLFMELFNGPNLSSASSKSPASVKRFLYILICQMIDAVHYLHDQKLIHCDIKPENFLVNKEGKLAVVDMANNRKFGGMQNLFSFKKKRLEGTPVYMSPEQIRCEKIDYRSDYYSLGLSFYTLITGKPPFSGSSQEEILKKNLKVAPKSISEFGIDVVCPQLNRFINGFINKKKEERYENMTIAQYEFRKTKLYELNRREPYRYSSWT